MWSWVPADPIAIAAVLGLPTIGLLVRKCADPVFLCAVVAVLHRDKARRDDALEAMRDFLSAPRSRRRALPTKPPAEDS